MDKKFKLFDFKVTKGRVVLGLILGTIYYIIWYWILKTEQENKRLEAEIAAQKADIGNKILSTYGLKTD